MASVNEAVQKLTIEARAVGVDETKQQVKDLGQSLSDVIPATAQMEQAISKAFDGIQKSIGAAGAGAGGGGLSFLASIGLGAAASAVGLGVFLEWVQKTNKELADMGAAARSANLNLTDFQKLQFATGAQGLSGSDFSSGAAKMATSLYDAARGENELSKLLDANNIKFKDANGLLVNTNQMFNIARGLIANGANEFDKIKIADMLGLTKEWVPALEQSAQAFTASKNEATALGLVIDSDTIAKAAIFTQEWQQSSLVFSTWMKAQLAGVIPVIDDLIGKAKEYESIMADAIKNKSPSAGPANATPNTADAQANDAAFNARVNAMLAVDGTDKTMIENLKAYWDALTGKVNENTKALQENKAVAEMSVTAASKAFDEGAAMSANMAGGIGGHPLSPTKLPTDASKDGGRDFWDRATASIDKHAAKLAADTIAVGQSAATQEQLRAEFSLLEAAKLSDRDVTDKQIEAYTELRGHMTAQQALQAAGIKWDADEVAAFDRTTASIKRRTEELARANINETISRGQQTAFLTPEDVQIANQLKTIYPNVATAMGSVEAQALRANQAISSTSQQISGGLTTALTDVAMGTKTAGQAFKDFGLLAIRAIEQMIIQLTIVGPLMRGLQGGASSLFPGLFPAGFMVPTASALGNVFDQGRMIHPYALGGIMSDIITRPTLFPMANGAGLAGEAGPEAIIPLKRGPDGRLGVQSGSGNGGSSGHTFVTNVTVSGSDITKAQVESLVVSSHKQLAKDINNSLPDRVAAINRDPRKRG